MAGDPAALAEALEQLDQAHTDLTAALEQAEAALGDLVQATDDQAVQQALEDLAAGLGSAADAAGDGLTALRSALSSLTLDPDALQSAFRQASQAAGDLGKAAGDLKAGLSALREALAGSDLSDAAGDLGKALDLMSGVTDDLAADAGDVHQLLSDLADRDAISFETPGGAVPGPGGHPPRGSQRHGGAAGPCCARTPPAPPTP